MPSNSPMTRAFKFGGWGLPLALAAGVWLTGCAAQKHGAHLGKEPDPVYDTAERIEAMPRSKAVVAERGPCYVRLRTADGTSFLIGSPAAGPDFAQFLELLVDGQTYEFPETFQKFQAQRKRGR